MSYYSKNIKNSGEMGVGTSGNMGTLRRNFSALLSYPSILLDGNRGNARKGDVEGTRYFMTTLGNCKDYRSGEDVKRYMYINNVPSTSASGFSGKRGLIPGIISNVEDLSPSSLMNSISQPAKPKCAAVTLPVRHENGRTGNENHHISLQDLDTLIKRGKVPANIMTSPMRNALNQERSEGFDTLTMTMTHSPSELQHPNVWREISERMGLHTKYTTNSQTGDSIFSPDGLFLVGVSGLLIYIWMNYSKKIKL